MHKSLLLLGAAAFWPAAVIAQSTVDQAAKAFGARESIESISLSPDGARLSYVAPTTGQGSGVYAVDLATGNVKSTTAVDGRKQAAP